jgi:hypothetical protein
MSGHGENAAAGKFQEPWTPHDERTFFLAAAHNKKKESF